MRIRQWEMTFIYSNIHLTEVVAFSFSVDYEYEGIVHLIMSDKDLVQ